MIKKAYAQVADSIYIQKGREVDIKSITRLLNEGDVCFGGTELFFTAQRKKWALRDFTNSRNGVIFLNSSLNTGVQF